MPCVPAGFGFFSKDKILRQISLEIVLAGIFRAFLIFMAVGAWGVNLHFACRHSSSSRGRWVGVGKKNEKHLV